ncbi:MAG: hypothetical protein WAK33_17335 [Silvibacterium sp.]
MSAKELGGELAFKVDYEAFPAGLVCVDWLNESYDCFDRGEDTK